MIRVPALVPELLLLSAAVFGPFAFGATEVWSVSILEALLFAAAAACAFRGLPRRAPPAYSTVLPAAAFIVLLGAVQMLNARSAASPAALLPFTFDRRATGPALVLWSSYAALLLSAPQALSSRGPVRRFLWLLFLAGSAIAVIGLMQKGQGNSAYYGLRTIRRGSPFGPYTNQDHAASMLVLAAFAGAGLWFARLPEIARIEQLGKRIEAWFIQALVGFLALVIVYAVLFIRSRGAIHAMVLSASAIGLASAVRAKNRLARRAGIASLAVSFALFVAFVLRHPAWTGREAKDSSAAYRLAMYANSFEISRDFPIFGTGLASYRSVFPVYQDRATFQGLVEHAHNDWLELLIQVGAVGFLAWTAAVGAALASAAKAWRAATSFETRCLGGACLAGALSFLLHGWVDFSFQIPANAVLFLMLIVAAASCAPAAQEVPE